MGKAWSSVWSAIRRGILAGLMPAAVILFSAVPAHAVAGDLDPAFGTAGKALPAITGASDIEVNAVAVQPDGKIVCAGTYDHSGGGPHDFVVFRLLPGGDLDTGFGSGGWVVTDLGSDADFPRDVVIQDDGKIVVAGAVDVGGSPRGVLVRYTSGGALDTAGFGTLGKAYMSIAYNSEWRAVALQGDGKIVVAGHIDDDFAVARYSTGGFLDTSFSSDGMHSLAMSDRSYAMDVHVYGTGQILAAGYTDPDAGSMDFAAARFHSGGTLDASFNTGGTYTVDIGSASGDVAVGVTVDQSGNIYLAGWSLGIAPDTLHRPSIVRLSYEGVLDSTFGTGGKAYVLTDDPVRVTGMALDPQGQPVLAGNIVSGTYQSSTYMFRFTHIGNLDHGFGDKGQVVVDHSAFASMSGGPVLDAQGRLVLGGNNQADPIVTRHQTDDHTDRWGAAWWWSDPSRNDSYLVETDKVTIKATAGQDTWNCQRGNAPVFYRDLPAGEHWAVQTAIYVSYVQQDTLAGLVLWNAAESGSAVHTLYVGLTNLLGAPKVTVQGSIPEECAEIYTYVDYPAYQTVEVKIVRFQTGYSFYYAPPLQAWEFVGSLNTAAEFNRVGLIGKTWHASNDLEAEFSYFRMHLPGAASGLDLLLSQ